MHRLRTVTSLDVSAVAGHHAMPAALLFKHNYGGTYDGSCSMFSNVISLVLRDGDTDSEKSV